MEKIKMEELMRLKQSVQLNNKGKDFKNMSSSDKDKLLETVCKLLNLID